MKLKDVPNILHIDKHDLDQELVAQAGLVFKIGSEGARATSNRDGMKEEIKTLEAQANGEYRAAATKTTERALDMQVAADTRVVESKKVYAKACEEVRLWDVAFESIKARGFVLQKLVDFTIATSAAVGGQSQRPRTERHDAADDEVQGATKRRRRHLS